jgi:hypothetical protein
MMSAEGFYNNRELSKPMWVSKLEIASSGGQQAMQATFK